MHPLPLANFETLLLKKYIALYKISMKCYGKRVRVCGMENVNVLNSVGRSVAQECTRIVAMQGLTINHFNLFPL